MPKQKAPTPQELYRQRKQREEREREAYLPPGLINHGNTCFMNSVLQGLIATSLLSDLVHFYPIPPHVQAKAATTIVSRRSPQLTNGHNIAGPYEQPWVKSMPIGDMFLNVVYKAWDLQARRQRDILSPKSILSALGQKYDQYLDFAQQDAHEFLRILLDAMRMEEQDVIKKRQPPPPPNHPKKRRRTTITPSNVSPSQTPSPQPRDQPPSLSSPQSAETSTSAQSAASTSTPGASTSKSSHPQTSSDPPTDSNRTADEELPLLSFADMLFGGQLTSILVCQKCKHISQTYEDFNDISLSIKPEDYYNFSGHRKRDRLKNFAKRLTVFPGVVGTGATSSVNGKDKDKKEKKEKDKKKDKGKEKEKEEPASTSAPPASAPVQTQSTPHLTPPAPTVQLQTHTPTPSRTPLSATHALDIQRSSSVPPSPSVERPGGALGGGHDEPPAMLIEPHRRRSLDLLLVRQREKDSEEEGTTTTTTGDDAGDEDGDEGEDGFFTPEEGKSGDHQHLSLVDALLVKNAEKVVALKERGAEPEKEIEKEERSSDSSHVIVNVTGPEDRHVEFVEAKGKENEREMSDEDKKVDKVDKETEKKHEEATWTKIGRRISLTVGLGRMRGEKDKKDRQRKSRSMERSGLVIKEEPLTELTVSTVLTKAASHGADAAPSSSSVLPSEQEVFQKIIAGGGPSSTSLSPQSNKPLPPRPTSISQASDLGPPSRTATPPPAASSQTTKAAAPNAVKPPTPMPVISAPTPVVVQAQNQPTTLPPKHLSRFPSVLPRSKSPKPPKPSAAEAEYLRRILADVGSGSFLASSGAVASGSTGSLINPFALFKPPLLSSHSGHGHHFNVGHLGGHGNNADKDGGKVDGRESELDKEKHTNSATNPIGVGSPASWLGFGVGPHLSGIEECLRMFTAVEVLDGENMVGCRRCWKIEHGMLGKGREKKGAEEEEQDSEEEKEEETSDPVSQPSPDPVSPAPEVRKPHPPLIHLPTSISSPSISISSPSMYSRETNGSDTRSVSSLPTQGTSVPDPHVSPNVLKDPDSAGLNEERHLPLSLSIIPPTPQTSRIIAGPGGLPIPIISTTAPAGEEDSLDVNDLMGSETPNTDRDSAYSRLTGESSPAPATIPPSRPIPHPRLPQGPYGSSPSSASKDSLVIPHVSRPKALKRRTTYESTTTLETNTTSGGTGEDTDEEDEDGEESDTSVATSVSVSSQGSDVVMQNVNSVRSESAASATRTIRSPSITAQNSSSTTPRPSPPAVVSSTSGDTVQGQAAPQPKLSKAPKPPKPVIMRPAYKRYLISIPPPVLVIHLKRFQQTAKTPFISFSHGFKKLDDYVSFPEYLDLTPFLAPRKEDYGLGKKTRSKKDKAAAAKSMNEKCVYRLYAVVVHIGHMLGGHYIAYTALPETSPVRSMPGSSRAGASENAPVERTTTVTSTATAESNITSSSTKPTERQWAYISDTVVRLTTLEEVLHAKAYMCMYERII